MMRLLNALLLLAVVCPVAFAQHPARTTNRPWTSNAEAFTREVDALRNQLDIPGLAVAIVQDGAVLHRAELGTQRDGRPFTTETPLRIASVTKSLTAVLVLQSVERGEIRLSDPVTHYLPDFDGPPNVTVTHVLTHTSEGIPGEEYVYATNRYALLADVLEAATGQSFESLLRTRLLGPAGMRWRPSPHLGAHAGLTSTVEDLAQYAIALDEDRLLSPARIEQLMTPSLSTSGHTLPTGLGWFVQTIQGVQVTWSFGQADPDHSGALFLRVPERGLTLAILANANVLSDPFRLLMGDVRTSPFATAFLRLFVASPPGEPLPAPDWAASPDTLRAALERHEAQSDYVYADDLVGGALVYLWNDGHDAAAGLFHLWRDRYSDLAHTANPALLFPLVWLPDESMTAFGIAMGKRLLREHRTNRWILLPLAYLHEQRGEDAEAVPLYEAILALPNQHPDHLHRLFTAWAWIGLAQYWSDRDAAKARRYLRNAIDLDVGGGTQAEAEQSLRTLNDKQ